MIEEKVWIAGAEFQVGDAVRLTRTIRVGDLAWYEKNTKYATIPKGTNATITQVFQDHGLAAFTSFCYAIHTDIGTIKYIREWALEAI